MVSPKEGSYRILRDPSLESGRESGAPYGVGLHKSDAWWDVDEHPGDRDGDVALSRAIRDRSALELARR